MNLKKKKKTKNRLHITIQRWGNSLIEGQTGHVVKNKVCLKLIILSPVIENIDEG